MAIASPGKRVLSTPPGRHLMRLSRASTLGERVARGPRARSRTGSAEESVQREVLIDRGAVSTSLGWQIRMRSWAASVYASRHGAPRIDPADPPPLSPRPASRTRQCHSCSWQAARRVCRVAPTTPRIDQRRKSSRSGRHPKGAASLDPAKYIAQEIGKEYVTASAGDPNAHANPC